MSALVSAALAGCTSAPLPHAPASVLVGPGQDALVQETRLLMGTRFEVSLVAPESPEARAAIDAVFAIFEEVERSMSEWRPESPLSALNRAAGVEPVKLPADLLRVLALAKRVAEESGGAFDPTWAALWDLWRFGPEGGVPPDPEAVRARLPLVDWRRLVLDEARGTAFLTQRGMAVGLGGIAKGWALEQGARELRRRGYEGFLLNAGGQVYAGGKKGDAPWRVGVQDPRGASGDIFAKLEAKDESVSTSGDYEHSFLAGGVRYHHIIDPHTGWPARGVMSVTVAASDATLADAYSTAVFVLGPERGLELSRGRFDVLIVTANGELVMSDGMRRRLRLLHPPTAEP